MNILIVKYLPSGEFSNSKKLYDYFLANVIESEIHEVDLVNDPIPHFNQDSLTAYYSRNFLNNKLTPEQELLLKPFDEIANRVVNSDLIVFVFPMHNFSLPGIVKLYFDAFMQKGKVYQEEDGKLIPLLINKKALVLYSHGGDYSPGTAYASMDIVRSLILQEFSFMGISKNELISFATNNKANYAIKLEEAQKKIYDTLFNWNILKKE